MLNGVLILFVAFVVPAIGVYLYAVEGFPWIVIAISVIPAIIVSDRVYRS